MATATLLTGEGKKATYSMIIKGEKISHSLPPPPPHCPTTPQFNPVYLDQKKQKNCLPFCVVPMSEIERRAKPIQNDTFSPPPPPTPLDFLPPPVHAAPTASGSRLVSDGSWYLPPRVFACCLPELVVQQPTCCASPRSFYTLQSHNNHIHAEHTEGLGGYTIGEERQRCLDG